MINITELKKRLLSEAQELSPKQKKIAGAAEPKDKITGADFVALKAKKGMKEGDHEVSMAHNSLESIIKSAMELKAKLGGDERNIPGWIQDHITNAENFIDQASQGFHELSPEDQGEEDVDELPDGTEEEPVADTHNLSLAGMMEDMLGEEDDDDYGDTEIHDRDTEYDTGVDEAKKKPSAGLTKKQKSAIVKKAKKGKDFGKKGKGFEKVVKAAKKGGAKDPQAVAGAAFWKSQAKKAK